MLAKDDDLSHQHLSWLVNSRTANQRAALWLFMLFETYSEQVKGREFSQKAQTMVAICFSLWRAAFLADKTGVRAAVLKDAKAFLGKMLTDNAITYPQDRSNREWTFNYYMNNAKDGLLNLSKDWIDIQSSLSVDKKEVKGATASSRRWDRHQNAFETALHHFEEALKKAAKRPTGGSSRPSRLRRAKL